MTFPLEQDGRSIPAVPGARKIMISRDDALAKARDLLSSLETRGLDVFPRVLPDEPETDPVLAGIGELVNGRLSLVSQIAILPPSRRFDTSGHRLLGVRPYANGYTGFGIAPSEFRPGLSIWGFSESGLLRHEEYATPWEWLVEYLSPFAGDIEVGDADLAALADEQWLRIEGDLQAGAPPEPRGPIADGLHTSVRDGLEHEEHHRDGLRHGDARAWDREEIFDDSGDADPAVRQFKRGALRREGGFVDGFAHGPFRLFSDTGKLAQEVSYHRGFPHGRCTVQPEATQGICEPATVEYVEGVPTSWSIPPFASTTVLLDRPDAAPATLDAIANGPVVLIDCRTARDHAPPQRALDEVAKLLAAGVAVVGIGVETGRGTLGAHALEIVVDRDGKLMRAYGWQHATWLGYTAIARTGAPAGAGQLASMRSVAQRLGL